MASRGRRVRRLWRRTAALSWPIAVQQTFTTLMRTVDLLVTGLFSPVAVAAVGLADLYAQLPLRLGLGLGTGAIALSSQDTGRAATATRNRAITQAVVLGALAGLPLVVIGLTISDGLIAILGAEPAVVATSGTYLTLLFVAAPMRIVGLVGARALQGTGDTRTPMVVNGGANLLNIVLTVTLGLGIGPIPRLAVFGVGLATALSRTVEAFAITAAIASPATAPAFARPRSTVVTRQLVAVSAPNVAEGLSTSLANFPFNALLLAFGTEVVAGYHIARRIYQQLTGPLYRSLSTAASIIVGQTLGEGDPDGARFAGFSIMALGVLTLSSMGLVLLAFADHLAQVFTSDPLTIHHAAAFTGVFGISMGFFGVFFPLAGSLRGAGDTRTPFYARFIGTVGFMLGLSAITAVPLGFGLIGVYLGIVSSYGCWAVIAAHGFIRGNWADRAAGLIAERAATQ